MRLSGSSQYCFIFPRHPLRGITSQGERRLLGQLSRRAGDYACLSPHHGTGRQRDHCSVRFGESQCFATRPLSCHKSPRILLPQTCLARDSRCLRVIDDNCLRGRSAFSVGCLTMISLTRNTMEGLYSLLLVASQTSRHGCC